MPGNRQVETYTPVAVTEVPSVRERGEVGEGGGQVIARSRGQRAVLLHRQCGGRHVAYQQGLPVS